MGAEHSHGPWYDFDELVARVRADLARGDARAMSLVVQTGAHLGPRSQLVVTAGPDGLARRRHVTLDERPEDAVLRQRDRLGNERTQQFCRLALRITRSGSLEGDGEVRGTDDEVVIVIDAPRYEIAVVSADASASVVRGCVGANEVSRDVRDLLDLAFEEP